MSLKRTYLNSQEENFYMVANVFIQMMDGIRTLEGNVTKEVWEEWGKRGMMTPSMQKNLKMAYTYLTKFSCETFEHLDRKQQEKINKRLNKFDIKIIDDYRLQKLLRDVKDSVNYSIMERDKFIDIIEDVSGIECVGCKRDYKECALCKAFEDVSIPYLGEQDNCPYAVDLAEFTEEQKVKYEKLRERVRTNNKFARGE